MLVNIKKFNLVPRPDRKVLLSKVSIFTKVEVKYITQTPSRDVRRTVYHTYFNTNVTLLKKITKQDHYSTVTIKDSIFIKVEVNMSLNK